MMLNLAATHNFQIDRVLHRYGSVEMNSPQNRGQWAKSISRSCIWGIVRLGSFGMDVRSLSMGCCVEEDFGGLCAC